MNISQPTGVTIGGAIVGTLGNHLPNRTKRIVFLTSLAGRLKEDTLIDDEVIRGINGVFQLAKSDAVLEFPYELSKIIWRGKTSNEICRGSLNAGAIATFGIAYIVRCIMDVIPTWLRYGPDEQIERDVETLLENRSITLGLA